MSRQRRWFSTLIPVQATVRGLPVWFIPTAEQLITRYDDKGNAKTDNDFGHDHPNPQTGAKSGDPHAHDWVNGQRGPSRPLGPGE